MADKKISEFVAASAFAPADIIPIVQGGANKKITFANLFAAVNTPYNGNTSQADIDFRYSGVLDPELVFFDASTDRVGFGTALPQTKVDVDGSFSTNGFELAKSFNLQTDSGAVTLQTNTTILNPAASISVTLSAGLPGQKKTIVNKGPDIASLTGVNFAGFNSIIFNSVGDSVTLIYLDNNWYILNGYGVVVA